MIGDCCGPCSEQGFNDQAVRVHVWRGDGWDWGSQAAPQFIFVSGSFTKYGKSNASRIAKFRKSNSGKTVFDKGFANNVAFSNGMTFCSTSRGSAVKLLVGNLGRMRQGVTFNYFHDTGTPKIAWLIDPVSGQVSFSIPDPEPQGRGVQNAVGVWTFVGMVSAIEGKLGLSDFIKFHSIDIGGAATITRTGNSASDFVHGAVGMNNSWYMSERPRNWAGFTTPRGIRLLNANLTQKAQFVGSGTTVSTFTIIGFPNQKNGDDKFLYVNATKEFTYVPPNPPPPAPPSPPAKWVWNGVEIVNPITNIELINVNSVLFAVQQFGGLLAQHFVIPVETNGTRAEPMSVDHVGRLWFTGGILKVFTRAGGGGPYTATETVPHQLYRHAPAENPQLKKFEGFNGGVNDCRYFADGPTQGRQYIVIGAFTRYTDPVAYGGKTHVANRILYIDENGKRLKDLEWP